jgi:hypothetical protein
MINIETKLIFKAPDAYLIKHSAYLLLCKTYLASTNSTKAVLSPELADFLCFLQNCYANFNQLLKNCYMIKINSRVQINFSFSWNFGAQTSKKDCAEISLDCYVEIKLNFQINFGTQTSNKNLAEIFEWFHGNNLAPKSFGSISRNKYFYWREIFELS